MSTHYTPSIRLHDSACSDIHCVSCVSTVDVARQLSEIAANLPGVPGGGDIVIFALGLPPKGGHYDRESLHTMLDDLLTSLDERNLSA
jgi:hypothetical protein